MPRRDTLTKRRGRPSALTDRTAETIIAAILRGTHINTACHLAGVGTTTFYRWMEKADRVDYAIDQGQPYDKADLHYRDFRDAMLDARAQAADRMVDVVQRAAVGGYVVDEHVALDGNGNVVRNDDGTVVMERKFASPDGRLALAYLKVAQPAEWGGNPSRVELSGPSGGPMQVESGEPDGDTVSRLASRLKAAMDQRAAEEVEREVRNAALPAGETGEDDVHDAEIVQDAANRANEKGL